MTDRDTGDVDVMSNRQGNLEISTPAWHARPEDSGEPLPGSCFVTQKRRAPSETAHPPGQTVFLTLDS